MIAKFSVSKCANWNIAIFASLFYQALGAEVLEEKPDLEKLGQTVQKMMRHASKAEQQALQERFAGLKKNFTSLEDLATNREELCQQWGKYSDVAKVAQLKVKALQQKLTSKDLSQEEINVANQELAEVQASLAGWEGKRRDMDELVTTSQMTIKDRPSKRTLQFEGEVQNLQASLGKTNTMLEEKQGKLDQLTTKWSDFENQKKGLLGSISEIRRKLEDASVTSSSLDGVKDLAKQIKALENQLDGHNPDYENFRELSRELVSSDPANMARTQNALGSVEGEWERLQTLLAEKGSLTNKVATQWQQYTDSKNTVNKVLSNVEGVLSEEEAHTNQPEVKHSLDKYKVCFFVLMYRRSW